MRFHGFIASILWFLRNEVLFVKIRTRVEQLWLDTTSGPKWPNYRFLALDFKIRKFFEISWFYWILLMILQKMRSCLWKFKLGFWTDCLICPFTKTLDPNCPKLVFWSQTSNVAFLGFKNFFMASSIRFCMKQAFIFKIWVIFDKVISVYSLKTAKKKTFKNLLAGATSDM